MPDDLVKPHSATRKVDALNRSHCIPVGRERIVTGLVLFQVVANIPTVVVEKPRDGQWGCELLIPFQIDPVVRRHTSPATRRRWFFNDLFVGLGYDRLAADTSLRCALRPVIVVSVEYKTSAHGFAHQRVPVMACLIAGGTPKTSTEFPSRTAMPMLTLGDLNKDAVVVGVRIKHQGTTHKSLLLPKRLSVFILNAVLRPVLAKWHPMLLDYEKTRAESMSTLDHERRWDKYDELRDGLEQTRVHMNEYAEYLREVAGVPSLIVDRNEEDPV